MKHTPLDQPWHRPGAFAYARKRRRAAMHPPVTVYPMPADVTKEEDVPVQMRDGVVLRLNLFRPSGRGAVPGYPVGAPLRQRPGAHEEARQVVAQQSVPNHEPA